MIAMQAAMGRVQVGRLDDIIRRKRENATALGARLRQIRGVTPPAARPDREHVHMLYSTLLDGNRDTARAAMLAAGVEVRLYFPPAHLQQVFIERHVDLPVTEDLSRRRWPLPFHARLTRAEFDEIATSLDAAVVAGC
jgi:perosamine synthetase